MIKVMLIGDSIRLGYEERLRELLKDKAEIHSPEENCRFAAYTLFSLSSWVPDDDYDVIHWNNGQWDTCYMPDGRIHTPLPMYLELEQRIAEILRPKARSLIFATTTPVRSDQFKTASINGRKNEDIEEYNAAVSSTLEDLGAKINDLHGPCSQNVADNICEDKVHLSPSGIDLCARRVADAVAEETD